MVVGSAPVDQSVYELADSSPVSSVLNTPTSTVLSSLGLSVPAQNTMSPAPGIPPLPPLNLELLLKPLMDILGVFGTGSINGSRHKAAHPGVPGPSGPAFDPTSMLQGLSSLLTGSKTNLTSAMAAVGEVWSGVTAINTALGVGKNAVATAETALQATLLSINAIGASVTVYTGLTTMEAIIAKTIAQLTALAALCVLPGGQAAMLGTIIEALVEAQAAVATTKITLAPQTAKNSVDSVKVPTPTTPTSLNPLALASGIGGLVTPVVGAGVQGAALAGDLTQKAVTGIALGAASTAGISPSSSGTASGKSSQKGSTPGMGSALKGVAAGLNSLQQSGSVGMGGTSANGNFSTGARPLDVRSGLGVAAGLSASAAPNLSSAANAGTTSTTNANRVINSPIAANQVTQGMMVEPTPVAPIRRADDDDDDDREHTTPDYLITEAHGAEVLGELPTVAPAVISERAELSHNEQPRMEPVLGLTESAETTPDVPLKL